MASKLWKFIAFLTPTYLLYRFLKKYSPKTDAYTLSARFDAVFLLLALSALVLRYLWEKTGTPYASIFLALGNSSVAMHRDSQSVPGRCAGYA